MGRKYRENSKLDISNNKTVMEQSKLDDCITILIRSLNHTLTLASSYKMGTAVKILSNAKEELVHWAVDMNFHETGEEKFLNKHLYDCSSYIVGDFIEKIRNMENTQMRDKILQQLGFLDS